jgi:hypothetical protein
MPATGRRTTLVSGRYMRTKSKFTVVRPASASAAVPHERYRLEKDLGQHHGEPQFRYTPPLELCDKRREELKSCRLVPRSRTRRVGMHVE